MILYHGSAVKVEKPDTLHCRKAAHFGQGFYATAIYEQAVNWCDKFKLEGGHAYITSYSLDEAVFSEAKVLRFESYSEEWLDFIIRCIEDRDSSGCDVVTGIMANESLLDVLELLSAGSISRAEAIEMLKYDRPKYQICFRTQDVLDRYLHFENCEEI